MPTCYIYFFPCIFDLASMYILYSSELLLQPDSIKLVSWLDPFLYVKSLLLGQLGHPLGIPCMCSSFQKHVLSIMRVQLREVHSKNLSQALLSQWELQLDIAKYWTLYMVVLTLKPIPQLLKIPSTGIQSQALIWVDSVQDVATVLIKEDLC